MGNSSSSEQDPKTKIRTSSAAAEAVVSTAQQDEIHSRNCRAVGNVLIGIGLLIYTIIAWIEYADTKTNRTTIVKFRSVKKEEFPAIFFEMAEHGTLENVKLSLYVDDCDLQSSVTPTILKPVKLLNPTSTEFTSYNKDWLLVNTSLASYGYSGYGNFSFSYNASSYESSNNINESAYSGYYSGSSSNSSSYSSYYRRRQLLSSPATTSLDNQSYADYFENYSYSDYYKSSSSNIFYILPPSEPQSYQVQTNRYKKCGDILEVYFRTSVAKSIFTSLTNTSAFNLSLYVRAFPGSFGIQYGYDSRQAVIDSYTGKKKGHIYYNGQIGFGELKLENLQLTISQDEIANTRTLYYSSVASIDLTNVASNSTLITDSTVYFDNYLYVALDDLLTKYQTVQAQSWSTTLALIGGMYQTLSSPVLIVIALWLYGFSLPFYRFNGKAPMDPLPDDMLKRLNGYLAEKIVNGELQPGEEWKKRKGAPVPKV